MAYGKRFKQPYDRRVRWMTAILVLLGIGCIVFLAIRSGGSYLPGWFGMILLAALALVSLSIPKFIFLTNTALEVHCLVKFVGVPLKEIRSVRAISRQHMKHVWPIPFAGTYAVFGYFGYYFDFKTCKSIKVYARAWDNFVIVEDVFDEIMIIGVPDQQDFIDTFERKNRSF